MSRPVRGAADGWEATVDRLARELFAAPGPDEVLSRAVVLAEAVVPGTGSVSITVLDRRRRLTTVAASSDLARTGDALQYGLAEGPCLDAAASSSVVHSPRLAGDDRWPRWRPRAVAELDLRSMLSLALQTHEQTLGSLNLYGLQDGGLDEQAVAVAGVVAVQVAFAYAHARDREHLETALVSRNLIGQAQGILMERHKLTADRAFDVLVDASQSGNVKLVEIARRVVETGLDPGPR